MRSTKPSLRTIRSIVPSSGFIIVDLYLLKRSGDFEKQQLYLAHLEDAVERVQATLDELARVGQVDFDAHNDATSQK